MVIDVLDTDVYFLIWDDSGEFTLASQELSADVGMAGVRTGHMQEWIPEQVILRSKTETQIVKKEGEGAESRDAMPQT